VKPTSTALTYVLTLETPSVRKKFLDDLDRNPRNPRSLWGLHEALLKQKRDYDAGFVEKQFETSWKGGSKAFKLEDLL